KRVIKMWPQNALMVKPVGFRVDYAINPHMLNAKGELNAVNEELALKQWQMLLSKFRELGINVDIIEGDPKCPDMVFCANQTLPYFSKDKRKSILLSNMHSDFRKPEVKYFKEWADKNNFETHTITDFSFEGCGDAIWNYETGRL